MAKTINTRIQLKIDTLTNWNASTFVPLAGEVCIAKVDTVEGSTLQPTMIKVGDGVKTFANLDWASAKAADVYGWAKAKSVDLNEQKLQFTDAAGTVLKEVDLSDFVTADELATAIGEVVNTITTVTKGAGIEVEDNGTNGNHAYVVSHANTSDVANLTAAARTYVTGLTFDDFGHVTGVTTGTEEDQDLSNFKTKQKAVDETGAENKTLKISQNENGEISVEAVNIAITSAQVTDLDTGVMSVTGKDAITVTGDENVEVSLKLDNTGNVALTQSNVGLKADIDLKDYATTDAVDKAIDDAVKGLLGDNVDAAYDTFKELQNILDGEEGAQGLIDEVAANKSAIEELTSGDVAAPKADVASSLDAAGIEQVKGIKVNSATNADTADKVANSLTITGDGVTETTFDGSAAKTVTIDLSNYQEKGNYQPAGDYKTVQNAVADPAANGKALAFIDSISQNANGVITATKKEVNLDDYAKSADLHEIATTGSLKDAAEATDHATVTGDKDYIIFNCGSSSINV